MRMEVHLEGVLSPSPPTFIFQIVLQNIAMLARKVAKGSLNRSQRDENEAKTASKDSQIEPRGPQRDLVEKKISF